MLLFTIIAAKYGENRERAIEPLKSGIENTSGGLKAGENNQPEELWNGFGYGNKEGESFNDEKHCKTLGGISINSNNR